MQQKKLVDSIDNVVQAGRMNLEGKPCIARLKIFGQGRLRFRRSIQLLATFLMLSLTTGCFNILHFISINKDGNLDIQWRLTMSAAMQQKSSQSPSGESLQDKFKQAEDKITDQLKGKIRDFSMSEIKSEHQAGISMALSTTESIRLENQDGMPLIPWLDRKGNKLVFFFRPDNKQDSLLKVPRTTKKAQEPEPATENRNAVEQPDSKEEQGNPNDQMMELVKAILSSARYQIVLSDSVPVKSVYLQTLSDQKRVDVTVLRLGSQHIIDFPFMSYLMADDQGFDLVVELR
ncbi:MAG: hypothetical protein KDK39_13810 [Leptospiraceae bacterium]|nr:hypothetical protein [Leptospiraceae bacterium]